MNRYELPNLRWYTEEEDFMSTIIEIKDGKERMLRWNEQEEYGHTYMVSQVISKDFGEWIDSHKEYYKLYLEECWRGCREIESITLDDTDDGYNDCYDLNIIYKYFG